MSNEQERQKMDSICKIFGLTVDDVEQKLNALGEDGMLIDRVHISPNPQPIKYYRKDGPLFDRFYYAMASLVLKDVKNVLEIGSGLGHSTIVFSKLFPNAKIYTVDIPTDDPNWVKNCRSKPGPSATLYHYNISRGKNIIPIKTNSFFLSSVDLPKEFKLILVDGTHELPQVAGDIMYGYGRISDGGFLFMHDYTPRPQRTLDVGVVVHWIEKRISERIFLFPMIVPPDKPEKKMALIVKNRFFKEE